MTLPGSVSPLSAHSHQLTAATERSIGNRVKERLAGSSILLTGGSGFLGKVVLATLLRDVDGLERLMVLLRAPTAAAAEQRLVNEVLASDAFAALSGAAIRKKLENGQLCAMQGDLRANSLGHPYGDVWKRVDTVIHCAAMVSFEAPLDEALILNTLGPIRLLNHLRRGCVEPHFVHISTAYVAGRQTGTVREDGLPRAGVMGLDAYTMLEEAQEWRAAAERESLRDRRRRRFVHAAKREGARRRCVDAVTRAEELRERWVRQKLAERGRRYAVANGWMDAYTLTKALGERLLVEQSDCATIIRPSIIESALERPQPGWLEGIKVADPLILAYAAGALKDIPGRPATCIDIVPVDLVANACVAAAAHPPSSGLRMLAITSSARNALTLGEFTRHVREYFLREPLPRRNGAPIAVPNIRFAPAKVALRKTVRRERLVSMAARLATLSPLPLPFEGTLRRNSSFATHVSRLVKIYGAYAELDCVFDDSNTCALARALPQVDRVELQFNVAAIDWQKYMQETHLPRVRQIAMEKGE